MHVDLTRIASNPESQTVLGMPPTAAAAFADAIGQRFLEQLPNGRLKFIDGFSGHIKEGLAAGRIDVGVLYGTSLLLGEKLWTEELLLVGSSKLLGGSGAAEFTDLRLLPMIMPGLQHGLRSLVEHYAQVWGVKLNIVIEVDSLATILDLVQTGLGATVLPLAAVRRSQAGVQWRKLINPAISRTLILAASAYKPISPTTRTLLNIIRQEAQRVARRADSSV